ncbi:MAG: hypothetical protein LBL41_02560 [Bifidobacteriaceae bacterium]|jgi:hypothetical protein|nr:hypothetical protein [Bifidobacteriaceae bacterium]
MKKLVFILALVSVLILSACSASEPANTSANPYAEEVAELREGATNDMQLEVLADGKITDAEMQELSWIFRECLNEYHIPFSFGKDFDIGYLADGNDAEEHKHMQECRDKSVGNLQGLYSEQKMNPTKLDRNELIANCLVRRNLVPDDFTADDYAYYSTKNSPPPVRIMMLEDGTAIYVDDNDEPILDKDGNYKIVEDELSTPPQEETILPGGVSMRDDRVGACINDPRPESDNIKIEH